MGSVYHCYLFGELVPHQLDLPKSSPADDLDEVEVIGLHPLLTNLLRDVHICGTKAFVNFFTKGQIVKSHLFVVFVPRKGHKSTVEMDQIHI